MILKKHFKTIFYSFIFLFVSIICSCDNLNFMSGSKLKDKLDEEILNSKMQKPRIIEKNPLKKDEGVPKNYSIKFTFDMEMDPSSFRFTKEEILEINPDLKESDLLKDENGLIYAYKLDDNVYFKNILITSLYDDNKNINKHYYAPTLDNETHKILTIIANENDIIEITDKKTVSVEINPNIKSKEQGKLSIKDNHIFIINNLLDNDNPEFINDNILFKSESNRKDDIKDLILGKIPDKASNEAQLINEKKRY